MWNLSTQAWTILIVYLLTLLVSIIIAISKGAFNAFTLLGIFLWLLYIGIFTYDTNCLTRGSCDVWSWIRTILHIIIPILSLILLTASLGQKDHNPPKK